MGVEKRTTKTMGCYIKIEKPLGKYTVRKKAEEEEEEE